jgi:hypothetical protein
MIFGQSWGEPWDGKHPGLVQGLTTGPPPSQVTGGPLLSVPGPRGTQIACGATLALVEKPPGACPPPCPTETAGRRRGVAAAGPALAPAPRRPWWHGWPLPRPSGRHTRGRCRGRFRAEQWGTRLRGLGVGFLVRAVWAWVGPHAAAPRPARDAQAPPRATGQARLGSRRPRRRGGA